MLPAGRYDRPVAVSQGYGAQWPRADISIALDWCWRGAWHRCIALGRASGCRKGCFTAVSRPGSRCRAYRVARGGGALARSRGSCDCIRASSPIRPGKAVQAKLIMDSDSIQCRADELETNNIPRSLEIKFLDVGMLQCYNSVCGRQTTVCRSGTDNIPKRC